MYIYIYVCVCVLAVLLERVHCREGGEGRQPSMHLVVIIVGGATQMKLFHQQHGCVLVTRLGR